MSRVSRGSHYDRWRRNSQPRLTMSFISVKSWKDNFVLSSAYLWWGKDTVLNYSSPNKDVLSQQHGCPMLGLELFKIINRMLISLYPLQLDTHEPPRQPGFSSALFLLSSRLIISPLQEDSKDGMTRVYKSLVTNVCKEMSCYSDFPYREDYPNFMDHEKFWNYLREFAEHFGLLKYIQFKVR